MVCPPLIVTKEEIGEIVAVLGDTLEALAGEFDLPVNR
jgi:adenosylmethionine-8-amino-7-oxononanoate aminotransferase